MTEQSPVYGLGMDVGVQNVIAQRNAELRAAWLERRLRTQGYPDPLPAQARAWADWYLNGRRQQARLWLDSARETKLQQLIAAASNVIRLQRDRATMPKGVMR